MSHKSRDHVSGAVLQTLHSIKPNICAKDFFRDVESCLARSQNKREGRVTDARRRNAPPRSATTPSDWSTETLFSQLYTVNSTLVPWRRSKPFTLKDHRI